MLALACAFVASPAGAEEVYLNAGLPLLSVGIGHPIGNGFALRAEAGVTPPVDRNTTTQGIPYSTNIKYNRAAVFGDYFVFSGGFRLTGGLTLNNAKATLTSKFDGNTAININGYWVTPASGDYFNAVARYPSVMPYLGLGWGHNAHADSGFGLTLDVGASIGKPRLDTQTNMVGQTYGGYTLTQTDVDAKAQDVRASVEKVHFLPQVSAGLSYTY